MIKSNTGKYNKSKVRWACRRGMLELDKILINFCEQEFDNLSDNKKQSFIDLLEYNDTELNSWLIGDEIPAAGQLQDLVLAIRHISLANCSL